MRSLFSKLTYANVMATAAVFLALGGTATAGVMITGRQVKNGSLTGRDIRDRSPTAVDFASGQLPPGGAGAQGAQGAQGERGAQGSQGDRGVDGTQGVQGVAGADGAAGQDATKLWALVTQNTGTTALYRSSGAVSVTRQGAGDYKVKFNQNISTCSYAATPYGTGNNSPWDYTIGVTEGAGWYPSDTVHVVLQQSGSAQDGGFSLQVFC